MGKKGREAGKKQIRLRASQTEINYELILKVDFESCEWKIYNETIINNRAHCLLMRSSGKLILDAILIRFLAR